MTFVNWLGEGLYNLMLLIGQGFEKLFTFLSKPLGYLLSFLDGIWYFLTQLFAIAVQIVMIFVALFQYIGAVVVGFLRSIKSLVTLSFSSANINFPNSSHTGFQLVLDVLQPTGFMTVVPLVLLGILWIYFVVRIVSLIGGANNA